MLTFAKLSTRFNTMKKIILFLLFSIFLVSCSSVKSLPNEKTSSTSEKVNLSGKFTNSKESVKVYFEDELNKIVLSNGCQVVSANYQRFDPAISFQQINATQETCESTTDLVTILKSTILIEYKQGNQLIFKNQNQEHLLILSKN